MNKRLLNPISLFLCLLVSATAYSQDVTITPASGGLAGAAQIGGTSNIAIIGLQLNKAAGGGNTVTALTIGMAPTPVGKFTNARLYESTDATFDGIGSETLVTTGTISATDISFSGTPLTDFDGETDDPDDEYFFVVVDVDPAASGSTTPSLASTGVTVSSGTATGTTITGATYSLTPLQITMANLSTGLAASPLMAGSTGQGVFGFSLTSTGSQIISEINIQVSSTAVSKWDSYALITSTDNSFATTGDNSAPIGGLTFDASSGTEIIITGLSESITTTGKNYFLVVDVSNSVNGGTTAIQPSLGNTNISVSSGTVTGSASGTNYSFTAPQLTIANLATGLASSPLIAGSTEQGVFGFSLTSSATQTVSALNIQASSTVMSKWSSYALITSTDNSLATSGDNSVIGGLSFDASSGTEIAITGLSENITTTGKNYFLVVTIDPSVTTATASVQPSLGSTNVTTTGTATGTATGTNYSFAPSLTITNLSTGLAASPLVAGTTDQAVFGFSLTSTASQTVTVLNIQLTSTPASKWSNYRLITSTDGSYATTGDNSIPIDGLTFTPSASQIAITGLSEVITTGTNYFLVVDVNPAVTGATTSVQPSLGAANVTITTGGGIAVGSATGTNYSFSTATATFTEIPAGTAPVISETLLTAGSNLQVLIGFSATSNSTQQITAINFNYTPATPTAQFSTERLYRSTTAGSLGVQIASNGTADGEFTGLTETINSTPVYFYLVVDVANSVTNATPSVQVAPTQAHITVAGNKNAFSINRTFTFGTSQLSDIVLLNTSLTTWIPYRQRQDASLDNTDLLRSTRLATYQIRDGAGSDPDNKPTNLTSLTISLTNHAYVRQIALFDIDTNEEIPGTEQTVTGASVTFTPSSPISTASDNGVKNIMVRATFRAVVEDHAPIHLTITGATANSAGSGFSPVAGWASTTTAPDNNLIDVVASKLVFNPALPTPAIGTDFSVTVKAFDGLNNLDIDRNDQFDLTEDGPGTLISFGGTPVASPGPFLSNGVFTWTDLRLSLSGSYNFLASDDEYDDALGGDATGNITINSPASTINTVPDPVLCYGNISSSKVLSDIIITESDPAGISGSPGAYSFSLALPTGFVFDQSVTSGVSLTGADLNSASGYSYPSANVVQFSFNLTGTSTLNSIIIGGLKIYHSHPGDETPSPASGAITRLGGTANISGVSAGTILVPTISAIQNNPAVSFTVSATVGNINENTTSFNASSPPVNLIGVPTVTPIGTFSGSGVTPGPFRFNPSTLAQGNYDITYLQTSANGCQSVAIKTFTVFDSGIGGLESRYCSNDAPSNSFTVSQTFIDNIFGPGWSLDHYTYYDPFVYYFSLSANANATVGATYTNNGQTFTVVQTIIAGNGGNYLLCSGTGAPLSPGVLTRASGTGDNLINFSYYYNGDFRPITSPNNSQFNPALPEYQPIYNYFGGQIPIGFAVCNNGSVPCNGFSNTGTFSTYQWVTVNPGPTVSFSLPSDIYSYCKDNAAVTLIGSPPNGPDADIDKFSTLDPNGVGAITSAPDGGGNRIWSFVPSLVTGVNDVLTSQTINITYTYKDPATECSNTSTRPVTVHFRPTPVPANDIERTQPGSIPTDLTIIQLCQGTTAPFSFQATNATYNYRWYEGTVSPGNLKGTSTSFTPPVNTATSGNTNFIVTRERNGCESIGTNLPLVVKVIGLPPAPVPNFSDNDRQYCVGATPTQNHFGVPGTELKWYDGLGNIITPIADDNLPTPTELSILTNAAKVYNFSVSSTETVNFCEGPKTPLTVTIKALPVVSITAAPGIDASKICTTNGLVRFIARDLSDPGNPATNGDWSISGPAGVLNDFPSLGEVDLNPLTATPGIYTLEYEYQNSANCSNTGSINLTILPKLTTSISIADACLGAPSIITNNTTPIEDVYSASWVFGDGSELARDTVTENIDPAIHEGRTTGTYLSPHHIFPNNGTFQVEGILTTVDGCSYVVSKTAANVFPMPKANFTSSNVCVESVTTFTATADIPIATYDWDFSKHDLLADPADKIQVVTPSTTFTYNTTGFDTVMLVVTTNVGCRDTVEKRIYSVPNLGTISASDSYAQEFGATDGGWIAGGRNSSWQWDNPIAPPVSTNERGWNTRNDQVNESSWVLSGCFNFTNSTKPVISIDVWSDGAQGVDGAVLQYNTNGNIEDDVPGSTDPDGHWQTLGAVGSGINWYNAQGISNNPGNQEQVSAGWTGKYEQWSSAIYKLDELNGQNNVVFRVAFASDKPKVNNTGFAFDNVFIGERSRVVLLENFTNTSPEANTTPATTLHNTKYESAGNVAQGEIVKIQYHTPFPGSDLLNAQNQQMNNSRAAFYGITAAPAARVDGGYGAGNLTSWFDSYNDDRVLTPSVINIEATTQKVGADVKINVTLSNTISQSIPLEGAHLFIVIVQTEIDKAGNEDLFGSSNNNRFVYVAKQMLPTAAGIPLSGSLAAGADYTGLPEITWSNPNGGDAIVIFVQRIDDANKNVLQAYIITNPDKPDVITSTEDTEYTRHINLYPNPANRIVTIELLTAVTKPTPVTLHDAFGRVVYQDVFKVGERIKTISTDIFADGIYMMQLLAPQGTKVVRKVMVKH